MKKLTQRTVLLVLAALLMSSPAALAQTQDETNEIRKLIEEFIKKTMFAAETLEACTGLSGLSGGESCDAADEAGFGLNCPETNKKSDQPHSCAVKTTAEIDASITKFVRKILKLSGKFSTDFQLVSSETSVDHNHQVCAEEAATCRERYVKRHEIVTAFIAVYQEGQVTVGLPGKLAEIPAYLAAVNAAQGKMISVSNRHFCKRVDHGEPLDCKKKPTGPITPGGGDPVPTGGEEGGGGTRSGEEDSTNECTEPTSES